MSNLVNVVAKTASGEGIAGRFGESYVLAPADSSVVDAVLELAREAERDHAAAPGRFLPRKVAGLVAQGDEAPTLAVVSAVEDGVAVLLVGDVTLTLVDGSGSTTMSGRDVTTWVDRIVREPWTSITLRLPGAGDVDGRSDLQGGVLTAGGLELTNAVAVVAVVAEPAPLPVVEADPRATIHVSAAVPVIVLDDGSVHSLTGDLVLGREPANAEQVRSGAATALTLDDPDVTMSRVHARIELVGGEVRLVDAGSANGTYTSPPGGDDWTKVGTGESVVLTPGTKVALGGRTFVLGS